MIGAVITFAGLAAAATFLGSYLDEGRTRDAVGSLFGFSLMAVGLIGIFT